MGTTTEGKEGPSLLSSSQTFNSWMGWLPWWCQGYLRSLSHLTWKCQAHLSMKQGSLFCLSGSDLSNHDTSCRALGIFGKLSMLHRLASTWFETVWSYGVEAIDYWTLFSQWKLNQIVNWKLYWNLGGVRGVSGKASMWVRFNKIEFNFTIFRAKVWKTLILEWILLLEIQTNLINLGLEWNNLMSPQCVHIAEFRNSQLWKCEK